MKKIVLVSMMVFIVVAVSYGRSHTVIEGDNLWNLAIENFGDGYEWRSIWDKNSQIENPDLIYPGDQLIISDGQVSVQRSDGSVQQVGTTSFKQDTTLSFDELTKGLFDDEDTSNVTDSNTVTTADSSADFHDAGDLNPSERLILALSNSEMNAQLLEYAQNAYRLGQRAVPFAYNEDEDSLIVAVGHIADETRHMYIPYQKVRVLFDTTVNFTRGDAMDIYREERKIKHNKVKYKIVVPVASGTFIKSSEDTAIVELVEVYGEVRNNSIVTAGRTYADFTKIRIEEAAPTVLDMNLMSKLSSGASIKPFSYIFVDKGLDDGVLLGDIVQGYAVNKKGASDYFPSMIGIVESVKKAASTVRIVKVLELTTDDEYLFKRVGRVTYTE